MILRRTANFNYSNRDEARVFARTIAENVNIAAAGTACWSRAACATWHCCRRGGLRDC
jgi:hypothetical protein